MAAKRSKSTRGKGKDKLEISDRPCLAFTILSEVQTTELLKTESPDDLETKICEFMKITDIDVDIKQAALLDYYVLTFQWAKTQAFTNQQASGFFTLAHTLLENIKEKQLSRVENLKELRKLLAGVGVENPDVTGGLDFFSLDQAKAIMNYLSRSFFQHYGLYQFVMLHTRAEEIIGLDLVIEVPKSADIPWPPPLDEGCSEEAFTQYVASRPPTEASILSVADGGLGDEAFEAELTEREAEIAAKLTPEEIRDILDSVCRETLAGLETEIAQKLRDREASLLARINKVHRVAET